MHRKRTGTVFALIFAAALLLALAVALAGGVDTAYANKGGCPNAAASYIGKGAVPPRGIHPDGGHGPYENGPLGDNSAHGSGPGQKNTLRCNPPPE